MKKIIVIVMASLCATACSSRYASNGEHIYTQSHNGQKLIVPKPLSTASISHFYDLPEVQLVSVPTL